MDQSAHGHRIHTTSHNNGQRLQPGQRDFAGTPSPASAPRDRYGTRLQTAPSAAEAAARKAVESYGLKEVEVHISGPGAGRETAARAIQQAGLKITVVKDVTPLPHNGCRAPSARRV